VFLKAGGLTLLSLGVTPFSRNPLFLQRAAWAAPGPGAFGRRRVLVTIFLRGAMDGLAAVPPLGDPDLRRLRPGIALPERGEQAALDLGVGFGLHPAFAPLERYFVEKRLAIVHAVGSPDPTRSHFDAQDYMETGTPGRKGTSSGWLNRVVGELGHEAPAPSPFQAVSLTSALPRSLAGEAPALAVRDLGAFRVRSAGSPGSFEAGEGFESLYDQTSQELLHRAGKDTFDAVAALDAAGLGSYRPASGARYPRSPLGQSMQQIAFLVKSDLGLEVAFAESGGWDTHVRQGAGAGTFAARARDLAESVDAFWTDLGSHQDDVTLLTMTEFGRTAAENGAAGTDHGHGSCLFVLGHHVDGGTVLGDWVGLDPGALYEGRDLPVTTDFRAVLSEVAGRTLGLDPEVTLFPGWEGEPFRVWTSG
jgi:uncharacterized protein (DUF1501 family)